MNFLQRVCANDLSQPVGSVMHTAMLNELGRYENDCSIARTAPGQLLVVSSPGQARLLPLPLLLLPLAAIPPTHLTNTRTPHDVLEISYAYGATVIEQCHCMRVL